MKPVELLRVQLAENDKMPYVSIPVSPAVLRAVLDEYDTMEQYIAILNRLYPGAP